MVEIQLHFEGLDEPVTINSKQFFSLSQHVKREGIANPNAYYLSNPQFKAVVADGFIGDTSKGGACNCEDVTFNPHGNGTHTECIGHISTEQIYMTEVEIEPYLRCKLIQTNPEKLDNGDTVITMASINWHGLENQKAVILNSGLSKQAQIFSGTNPCYIAEEVLQKLNTLGINHILTDLPSVDREDDEGKLAGHKAFFGYPEIHTNKTISELLFIEDHVKEGEYILNISFTPMQTDAVLSEIKIYPFTIS